jgi:hypothetical protein
VTGSPQAPTEVERAAIKEGYRALIRAKSPTSHLVELVVFGLSKLGMLKAADEAELTVYRASHDTITFGLYTNPDAAWTHCQAFVKREFPPPVACYWRVLDDDVTELMVAVHGGDDIATGYIVTPLTVASDPDGDE